MKRRTFFKTAALAGITAPFSVRKSAAHVVEHNWDHYDFGLGPTVVDRLYQGPFPQYPPEQLFPGADVVMSTTPTREILPSFGKGLITYIAGDMGIAEIVADNKTQAIEELVRMPLGQKLYIRPTWREIQQQRGRLNFPDWWKLVFDLARQHNKQVGLRIQLDAPDYKEPSLPDFVLKNVPMVKLEGHWRNRDFFEPRYDLPVFQEAFDEMNGLLAAELNGNPLVEFVDTIMYGFWGEGHTWPFHNNPFADYETAERTWVNMFYTQLKYWTKTPLVTNTEPDFSRVGDSEILDRTIRTHNWVRSDTIFIENTQIEALSNRPPWTAAILEVPMHLEDPIRGAQTPPPNARPRPNRPPIDDEGVNYTDNSIQHTMDVGANYWSLWNFHHISAESIMNYYQKSPGMIDQIGRKIGYRVRPSFIWAYGKNISPGRVLNPHDTVVDRQGLIVGFANDGIAGVPGVLRVSVVSDDGKVHVTGGLDAGYPLPGKVRQAEFPLPAGVSWEGLKLKAEIEVKGVRYPLRWACHQQTNPDGSLTLRRNHGRG